MFNPKFCIISALELYAFTVEGFCLATGLFTLIPQMSEESEDFWSLEYLKRTPEISDVLPWDAILGRARVCFQCPYFLSGCFVVGIIN